MLVYKIINKVLVQYNRKHYLQLILSKVDNLEKVTASTIYKAIGDELVAQGASNNDSELLSLFSAHPSDIVRCWSTYLIGNNESLKLVQKLEVIRPFTADRDKVYH